MWPFKRHEAGRSRKPRAARGFTLVEMLAVVTIVGILASSAIPMVQWTAKRQKEAELRQALRSIRSALDAYKSAVDQGRIQPAKPGSGYPERLSLLVEGVSQAGDTPGGKLYFLRRLPRDPFAPSHWPAEKTWGLRSHDSPPEQPRPGRDVFDVYSMSELRGLDGSRYRDW